MWKYTNYALIITAVMLLMSFGLQTTWSTPMPEPAVSATPEPILFSIPTATPTPTPTRPLDEATQKALQSFADKVNESTPELRDPSYEALMYFLIMDDRSELVVFNDTYTCINYAEAVKNNSEARGIRGYYLGLSFWDRPDGHLINAWHTVDAGWVYVDCCGFDADMIASGNWSFKTQVYPVAGDIYIKMAPKGVNYPVKGFGWGRVRDIVLFRDLDGQQVTIGKSSLYSGMI